MELFILKKAKSGGYTLIELLSVVAIISILGLIGAANYNHYVARAHMQEAKAYMSEMYMAERNFYAGNLSYTLCLAQLGIHENNPSWYQKGFGTGGAANSCGSDGTKSCGMYDFSGGTLCDPSTLQTTNGVQHTDSYWKATNTANPAGTFVSYGWTATGTAFTLGAEGSINSSTVPDDTWSLDQDKTLSHIRDGE